MIDPLRMVDVDREPLTAGDLNGEHLHSRKALRHRLRNLSCQLPLPVVNLRQNVLLHKKWAPRAHFAKPVKCGVSRIAAGDSVSGLRAPEAQAHPPLIAAITSTRERGSSRVSSAARSRST